MSKKKSYWDMMMDEKFEPSGDSPEEIKRKKREAERRKLEDDREKLKDEEDAVREAEVTEKWRNLQSEEERVRRMRLEKERKEIEARKKALENEKRVRQREKEEIERIKKQIEEKDRKYNELQRDLETKKAAESTKRQKMEERIKRLREQREKKEREKVAKKRKLEEYKLKMKEKNRERESLIRQRKEKERQYAIDMEERKKRELEEIEREHKLKRERERNQRKARELERSREDEERKRIEREERLRKKEERDQEFEREKLQRIEEEKRIEELRKEREVRRREKREKQRKERERQKKIKENNRKRMLRELRDAPEGLKKIYDLLVDQDDEEYFENFKNAGLTYDDLVGMSKKEMAKYIPDPEKRERFMNRIKREEQRKREQEARMAKMTPDEKKLYKMLRDHGDELYYDEFEKDGITYEDLKKMSDEELKKYIPDDKKRAQFKERVERERRAQRQLEADLRRMKPEMKKVYDLLKEQGDEEYFDNFRRDNVTIDEIAKMTDEELSKYIPDAKARAKFQKRVKLEKELETMDPSLKRVYDVLKTAGAEEHFDNFKKDGVTFDELKKMDDRQLARYIPDEGKRKAIHEQLEREREMERKRYNEEEMEERRREQERKRLDEERHRKNKPAPKTAPKYQDKPLEEMDAFERMKYEFFKRKQEMEGWSKDFDEKQDVRETDRLETIQEEKLEKGITINVKEVDDEDEEAEEFKLYNMSVTGLHQVIMKWSTYTIDEFDNFFSAAFLEKDNGDMMELKYDKDVELLEDLSYISVKFK